MTVTSDSSKKAKKSSKEENVMLNNETLEQLEVNIGKLNAGMKKAAISSPTEDLRVITNAIGAVGFAMQLIVKELIATREELNSRSRS